MKTLINGEVIDGRKVLAVIRQQPGYRVGGNYRTAQATTGGYRLYRLVSDKWMDASLKDVPGLAGIEGGAT